MISGEFRPPGECRLHYVIVFIAVYFVYGYSHFNEQHLMKDFSV